MKILLLIICCVIATAAECNTTSIPGVDTLDIFNNSAKLSVGTTIENKENVSVKCRDGFDPDIDYEDPYVMYCDHGDWSKEMACTPTECNTTSLSGVETLDIFNSSVKLLIGTTIESMENVSVKCRPGFDPDIDYEDPYLMSCDHGNWSKEFTCTPKNCNTTSIPGVETLNIFNDSVNLSVGKTIESMDNVSVKCRPGFDPDIDYYDPYVMTCDHGDWSKELNCTPRKCNTTSIHGVETLDIFNNSVKLSIGITVESMENVSVKCRPRFDPDIDYDDSYVMSCDHGDWSKELTCTPKKCNTTSIPGVETLDIFNDSVKLSVGTTIESMDNVSVKCRPGFDPDIDYYDPYVITCDHGDWSKELTCTPRKCNTTSIHGVETLDIFNNSVKLSIRITVESMENVSVKCRPGFDPDIDYDDSYVMSCDHGNWSKELTCTPKKCNTTSIHGVETLNIFNDSVKLSVGKTIESMDNVSVKCRPGFDPDIDYEDPYVMTCDHGDWSKALNCIPRNCNTTSIPGVETLDIFNNSVKLSIGITVESMENVSVKCRSGFNPDIDYEDPYVMTCDHGDWSKELTCTPKACKTATIPGVETLDIFKNGVQLSVGMNVESRENVSVKCRYGFDPDIDYKDPYVMTCDHGDWSAELTCTPKKCMTTIMPGVETLDIFNNGVKLSTRYTYIFETRENVSVKCRPGFDPDIDYEDPYVMTCDHGEWSKELTCTPRSCDIPDIPNADDSGVENNADDGGGIKHDTQIEVVCLKGYELSDGTDRTNVTCKFGNWTNLPSGCHETVEQSVSVGAGTVAGASIGGGALLILVGVVVVVVHRRSRRKMDIKPTDSIDNIETELRANDYGKINQTFPRNNRRKGLQTPLRANDYGKVDNTLPRANRREGIQTKQHHHSYENVCIDKPAANALEGLQTEKRVNPYENVDILEPRVKACGGLKLVTHLP